MATQQVIQETSLVSGYKRATQKIIIRNNAENTFRLVVINRGGSVTHHNNRHRLPLLLFRLPTKAQQRLVVDLLLQQLHCIEINQSEYQKLNIPMENADQVNQL